MARLCLALLRNLKHSLKVVDISVRNFDMEPLFRFSPSSTQKVVSGYLEYDGRIVKVDSLDAVKRFIAEVEATADNSDE